MPRVTVCLSVYNGADLLPGALDSVRAQTYTDYELLVLDDGSTDRSAEIAESYGARVVRQANAGLGAARRRMYEEAQGELIAQIDYDDVWIPGKLEADVRQLDETGAVLVHSDCWFIYEGDRVVPRDKTFPESVPSFRHILPTNWIIASSAVFRRQPMIDSGNVDPSLRRCSDWYAWFQIAPYGRFAHRPEKTVRYEVLETSLANAGLRFHVAQYELLRNHIWPRRAELFAKMDSRSRYYYVQELRIATGIAASSAAKLYDREGRKEEARPLHRDAVRMAYTVPRVWSRYLRHLI